MDDSESKKTRCLVQRPNRNKKVSEVSEEEEILDESKTKRETRLVFYDFTILKINLVAIGFFTDL